jgi:hypothetical protein
LWQSIVGGVYLLTWNGTSFSKFRKEKFAYSLVMPAERVPDFWEKGIPE